MAIAEYVAYLKDDFNTEDNTRLCDNESITRACIGILIREDSSITSMIYLGKR
jgi:hypothetical protein